MIICHVCNAECEDSMELCPVCGAVLNAEPQENEETKSEVIENPTLLKAFEDIVSAEIFKDILNDNEIRFAASSDMGDALQVSFGGVLVSEDIYVDESNFEAASELLEEFLNSEIEFEDIDGEI